MSIRYAKENDREKERPKGRREIEKGRRDIEREEEIRERDVSDIERKSEREKHRAFPYRVCALVENLLEISQTEK